MKKRKLLITISVLIAVMIFSVFADFSVTKAHGKSSDLFEEPTNITVKDNQSVPAILKDKNGNITEEKVKELIPKSFVL